MGLHFLDNISILFLRFSMLLRAVYCLFMIEYSTKSLDKTKYRGEYKGNMGVFSGSFKLTPSMLGKRIVAINWFVAIMICVQLFEIWKQIVAGVVH